jgi:hypothetical protein
MFELLVSQVRGLVKLLLDLLLLAHEFFLVSGLLDVSSLFYLEVVFLQSVFEVLKVDVSDLNSVTKISLDLLLELLEVSLILGHLSLNDLLLLLLELNVVLVLELLLSLFLSSLQFVLDLFKGEICTMELVGLFLESLLHFEVVVGEHLVVFLVCNVD